MSYDAVNEWTKFYTNSGDMAYPAEGVIRIFKGKYPGLKMPPPKPGDKILDVGCGDGRHFPFFKSLHMEVSGVEISEEITKVLRDRMNAMNIKIDIQVGHTAKLPYPDAAFDYLVAWNSCYYMSVGQTDFNAHVDEMARVLRRHGWIVISIPKKDCFIFQDSITYVPGYRIIQNDYFGSRNGEIMRYMESRTDVEISFNNWFDTFCHADIDMDWFGLSYKWHIFVAQKM